MKIDYSTRFQKDRKKLPPEVWNLWKKKLWFFLTNPEHPSLRVKKMSGWRGLWEFSINMDYRATFEKRGDVIVFRRIGHHDILQTP